jgi:hypothetical protein
MVAKKPDEERRVPLSIRVLPSTKERLQVAADQQGLSLGDLQRRWLGETLTEWERRHGRDREQVTSRLKKGDA